MTDKELIRKVHNGNKEAMNTIIAAYYDDIYRFCLYARPFLGFALSQLGWVLLAMCSMKYPAGSLLLELGYCLCFLFRDLVYSSPCYLLLSSDALIEISQTPKPGMWHISIVLIIAALMLLLCTTGAYRRYRRQQNI